MAINFQKIRLETERLILRPLRRRDVDLLFALRSDPEMVRYWSHGPLVAKKQAAQLVRGTIQSMEAHTCLELAIELRSSPGIIGTVTLHAIRPESRRGEIGYSLGREHQGQGLALEAMTRFVDYIFTDLDFNRLEADIHPENAASRRLLQRLHFKREGYMPERWIVDGEVSDSEVFGLLRRDWATR